MDDHVDFDKMRFTWRVYQIIKMYIVDLKPGAALSHLEICREMGVTNLHRFISRMQDDGILQRARITRTYYYSLNPALCNKRFLHIARDGVRKREEKSAGRRPAGYVYLASKEGAPKTKNAALKKNYRYEDVPQEVLKQERIFEQRQGAGYVPCRAQRHSMPACTMPGVRS